MQDDKQEEAGNTKQTTSLQPWVAKKSAKPPTGGTRKRSLQAATTLQERVSKAPKVCPTNAGQGAHTTCACIHIHKPCIYTLIKIAIAKCIRQIVNQLNRHMLKLFSLYTAWSGYIPGGAFQPPQRSAACATSSTASVPPNMTTPKVAQHDKSSTLRRKVLSNITNEERPRKYIYTLLCGSSHFLYIHREC